MKLQKFVLWLQYDNLFSDSLATTHEFLLEKKLLHLKATKNEGCTLNHKLTEIYCTSKQCQNRDTILRKSKDNHEGNNTSNMSHYLPFDDKKNILLRT